MLPGDARRELAESVQHTLTEEARRNEVRFAFVRAVFLLLFFVLVTLISFAPTLVAARPRESLWPFLYCGVWTALAVLQLVLLRRGWYQERLHTWVSLVDGLFVYGMFRISLRYTGGPSILAEGAYGTLALVCAILILSGGFRYRRSAILVSTASALGVFTLVAAPFMHPLHVLIGCLSLGAVGLLALSIAEGLRRAMAAEVGRSVLRRFLPDSVVRGAHQDPLALITVPRTVEATVLVSDLRGFTSLAEHMPPTELLGFLNAYQGAFATAVHAHGGVVDKFMGDGMLAVFGLEEDARDHAGRALRAAQAMCLALESVNASWAAAGRPPVRAGIGLHSGMLVTGCLGSGARLEFTVLGDTVNTASRLGALTKEHGRDVLVSDDTARLLPEESRTSLEPLGEVRVRGRQRLLHLHALRTSAPGPRSAVTAQRHGAPASA